MRVRGSRLMQMRSHSVMAAIDHANARESMDRAAAQRQPAQATQSAPEPDTRDPIQMARAAGSALRGEPC